MSHLSNIIEDLILTNIKIWKEASNIKDINNKLKTDLSPKERVKHFLEIRRLNKERSRLRFEIDKLVSDAPINEEKIDYAS